MPVPTNSTFRLRTTKLALLIALTDSIGVVGLMRSAYHGSGSVTGKEIAKTAQTSPRRVLNVTVVPEHSSVLMGTVRRQLQFVTVWMIVEMVQMKRNAT